ncbi:hypothetical protein [Allopusillimonas ginsengisoli]|nr:hypothetical protein [Allopusillimonas ginsengisoli]
MKPKNVFVQVCLLGAMALAAAYLLHRWQQPSMALPLLSGSMLCG